MSLRETIVKYVRETYDGEKRKVSIRDIQRNCKCSATKIYDLFPGKKAEIYRVAGVPLNQLRLEGTMRALKVKKEKKRKPMARGYPIQLTAAQSEHLYGIKHLEKGKDVSSIIDELLESDSEDRKYGLTLENKKNIWRFLEVARDKKWKIGETPDIVEVATKMHNLHVFQYRPDTIEKLIQLVNTLRARNWTIEIFVGYITYYAKELLKSVSQ